MDEWQEKVTTVAKEIEHYLETHPEAADSLEGIALWWVSRQRIRSELDVVRAALAQLADSGVVSTAQKNGKREPVYRLTGKRH